MKYFSHFETNQTLKNKNASNYEALNQQLSSLLYPQYRFLLKKVILTIIRLLEILVTITKLKWINC